MSTIKFNHSIHTQIHTSSIHFILTSNKKVMKKIVLILLITVAITTGNAQSVTDPIHNNDDIVTDMYYDYELTESNIVGLQCLGTLYLTLNITDDIDRLILERTVPHHPEDLPPKFMVKRELPLDQQVALQDYPWRIRFRIQIYYKDGSLKLSNTYNINDCIDEEDLKLLYESSSAAIVQDDGMDITLDNGCLHLRTPSEGRLDVIDLSGRVTYTKTINGSESFNIHDFNASNASILIIKLQSAEKTIVKKIHISSF